MLHVSVPGQHANEGGKKDTKERQRCRERERNVSVLVFFVLFFWRIVWCTGASKHKTGRGGGVAGEGCLLGSSRLFLFCFVAQHSTLLFGKRGWVLSAVPDPSQYNTIQYKYDNTIQLQYIAEPIRKRHCFFWVFF